MYLRGGQRVSNLAIFSVCNYMKDNKLATVAQDCTGIQYAINSKNKLTNVFNLRNGVITDVKCIQLL